MEDSSFMLELEVILEFTCCACGDPMGVTLKCAGAGLAAPDAMASVKVPCPNCQNINHIFFTPDDGALHHVKLDRQRVLLPVPSCN